MIDVDPSLKRGRRWVNKAIKKLDPEKDYVRIMALVAEYQQDEITLHMLITNTNIHVVKPVPYSKGTQIYSEISEHRSKISQQDSLSFFWTWFNRGPDYIDKIDSINKLDKNNQSFPDYLPGCFNRSSNYIYTFCLLATGQNRILKRLGLPEVDSIIKQASYYYMYELAKHFQRENNLPFKKLPESYEAMENYASEWEQWDNEYTPAQTDFINGLVNQYVVRNFPVVLHFIGQWTLLYTIRYDVLNHYRIQPLTGFKKLLARWILKAVFSYKIYLAADAKTSFLHRIQQSSREEHQKLDRRAASRTKTDALLDADVVPIRFNKPTISQSDLCSETNSRKRIG